MSDINDDKKRRKPNLVTLRQVVSNQGGRMDSFARLTELKRDLASPRNNFDSLILANGKEKYLKKTKVKDSLLAPDTYKLVGRSAEAVAAEIDNWLRSEEVDEDGNPRTSKNFGTDEYKVIKHLNTLTLAVYALSVEMDYAKRQHLDKRPTETSVLESLGKHVYAEMLYQTLKNQDKKLVERFEKVAIDKGSNHDAKVALLQRYYAGDFSDEDSVKRLVPEWSQDTLVQMGAPLHNAVFKAEPSCNWFTLETKKAKPTAKQPCNYIIFTETAAEDLKELEKTEGVKDMPHEPLTYKPLRWSRQSNFIEKKGCYEDDGLNAITPLVNNARPYQRRAIDEAMLSGQMDEVIGSVNYLNEQAFVVDKFVFEAQKYCYANNNDAQSDFYVDKFPTSWNAPHRHVADWDSLTDKQKKAVLRHNKKVKKRNSVNSGRRKVWEDERGMIEDRKLDVPLYVINNLDTRSRDYGKSHMNFQREERVRALFTSAVSAPITNEGVFILAKKIADFADQRVGGKKLSKASDQVKIQWVNDNEEAILDVGADYESHIQWWTKMGDPWLFLKACREYWLWAEHSGGDSNYMTAMPLPSDATNSGLQIYSALSLSHEDGNKTNLVANDEAQDIYQTVCDEVIALMRKDLLDAPVNHRELNDPKSRNEAIRDAYARQFLLQPDKFSLERKHCKQPTMTYPYGATDWGWGEQVFTHVFDPIEQAIIEGVMDEAEHPFPTVEDRYANFPCGGQKLYMVRKLDRAIKSVVKSADRGMRFIQDLTLLLAQHNLQLHYTTPLGFPFQQSYFVWNKKKVTTPLISREVALSGKREPKKTQLTVQTDQDETKVHKDDAVAGCAPNIIHALDATLLHKVSLRCQAEDIPLWVVHDSFSTLAPFVVRLNVILREEFVALFDGYCLYQDLLKQNAHRLPPEALVNLPIDPRKEDCTIMVGVDQVAIKVPLKGGADGKQLDLQEVIKSKHCFG